MMDILRKRDTIVSIGKEELIKLFVENGYRKITEDIVEKDNIQYKIKVSEFNDIFEVSTEKQIQSIFIAVTPHGIKNVQRWITTGIPWNMPWEYKNGCGNELSENYAIEETNMLNEWA